MKPLVTSSHSMTCSVAANNPMESNPDSNCEDTTSETSSSTGTDSSSDCLEEDGKAVSDSMSQLPALQIREALKFKFSGFSVWLELSPNDNNDLKKAIVDLAVLEGVNPIPLPHVTVLYGMTHLTQQQALHIFTHKLRPNFGNHSNQKIKWPDLRIKGILVDRSWDGVDGHTMDMSWTELTLATSPRHETLVDMVFDSFYNNNNNCGQQPLVKRIRPWTPHLSIVYDNPHESNLSLAKTFQFIATKYPTLLNIEKRTVEAISLWNTNGTMSEWKCLDRIHLL